MSKRRSFTATYKFFREWNPPDRPQYLFSFRDDDDQVVHADYKIKDCLQSMCDRWHLDGRRFRVTVTLLDKGAKP